MLKNKCPNKISRSGEKGKKVNCYSIRIDKDNAPFLLVDNLKKNRLIGKKWNGEKFSDEFELNYSELKNYDLRIVHYFGLTDISFTSIKNYAFNYFTKYIYIKLWLKNIIQNIDQYFFNKKKIVTDKKISLLKNILDLQLNKYNSGISLIALMSELYSFKWLNHPNKEYEKRKLDLYLKSLIDGGELQKQDGKYIVTGKAITTLEKYELSEERHVREVKNQRKIVFLTIIIAIATLLQTKIIDIPTILDFNENKIISIKEK
jgi:hypothetical protein